jgi:hypothetical protein
MPFIVLTAKEEHDNLEDLLVVLNDLGPASLGPKTQFLARIEDFRNKSYGYEDAVRLRRMVLAWQSAKRTAGDAPLDISQMKLLREDEAHLNQHIMRVQAVARRDGRLWIMDGGQGDQAALQFLRLLSNSQQHRLRGPCEAQNYIPRERSYVKCGKWFIQKTDRKEVSFCSRKCAAKAAKSSERNRKRAAKIKEAERALANYGTRTKFRNLTWQAYVAKATGLSKRFLFEAVRNGEISPPSAYAIKARRPKDLKSI